MAGAGTYTGLMKGPGRNDPCWCGSGRKLKHCHQVPVPARRAVPPEIARPPYALNGGGVTRGNEKPVKSPETIERMRRSGLLAADVASAVAAAAKPGVTTDELDELCHTLAIEAGAYPSPLGYGPKHNLFPKSLCTSINDVICHGIPGPQRLAEGDIVSLDVTVYREGVHGDTCVTVPVGEVDEASRRLVLATREALANAIAAIGPGVNLNEAGKAIEAVADLNGFGVVREFVGHGIGTEFHGAPQVPHYFDPRLTVVCQPGMTFTIEPMITAGHWKAEMQDDGWTAETQDGSRCAQFEHTLLITDDGVDILTTPTEKESHPFWRAALV